MDTKRVREIQDEIEALMNRLVYIDESAGRIFSKTLITNEEINFARKLPIFSLFKDYKTKLIKKIEELTEEIHERQTSDENMDLYFFIAAENGLLHNHEKMMHYANLLDWEKWDPYKTGRPEIAQAFRDFCLVYLELEKAHK